MITYLPLDVYRAKTLMGDIRPDDATLSISLTMMALRDKDLGTVRRIIENSGAYFNLVLDGDTLIIHTGDYIRAPIDAMRSIADYCEIPVFTVEKSRIDNTLHMELSSLPTSGKLRCRVFSAQLPLTPEQHRTLELYMNGIELPDNK